MLTVKIVAEDKNVGMTTDELHQFVTECERVIGNSGPVHVKARVGLRGQIKSLETKP